MRGKQIIKQEDVTLKGNLSMHKIPVLMYHSIKGRDRPGSVHDYEIKEDIFENQMHFLKKNGYSSVLFNDLMSPEKLPDKGLIITFDDGHLSNYTIAFPILRRLGFRAEFFVTSGQIEDNNRMRSHHLRELMDNGMSIGSHGRTHAYLDEMNDDEAKTELLESKERLENVIGSSVFSFSAPGGRFRERHVQIAINCGYRFFCTSRPGLIDVETSSIKIPRMPVHQNNVQDFNKIVGAARLYYFKRKTIVYVLDLAKKSLGNRLYESARGLLKH